MKENTCVMTVLLHRAGVLRQPATCYQAVRASTRRQARRLPWATLCVGVGVQQHQLLSRCNISLPVFTRSSALLDRSRTAPGRQPVNRSAFAMLTALPSHTSPCRPVSTMHAFPSHRGMPALAASALSSPCCQFGVVRCGGLRKLARSLTLRATGQVCRGIRSC